MTLSDKKNNKSKNRAVIFDFDGLLVDNEKLFITIWNEILLEYKEKISLSDYSSIYGKDPIDSSKYIVEKYKLDEAPENILRKRNAILRTHINNNHKTKVLPGASEFLRKLSRDNYPMALASNSYREYIEIELEKINFLRFFDYILCREDVKKGKPSPEIYLKASSCLRISPRNCLVLEDSIPGAIAAEKAGMNIVIINKSMKDRSHKNISFNYFSSFFDFLKHYKSNFCNVSTN